MITVLIVFALFGAMLLNIYGLHSIAPGRKYKSGTGWCVWRWTDVDSEYILRLHVVKTPWFAVCLHWIRAEPHDRHRIVFNRKNTLTLCFMGPKTREWGFHTVDGWLYWKDYYAKKRAGLLLMDKLSMSVVWKEIDAGTDRLAERFIAAHSGKIFVDEDVRKISAVPGDFDDEAPTAPYNKGDVDA